MKTQINCNSRLEAFNIIRKLERLDISFVENEDGFLADVTPEKAWNLSLI